MQHLPPQSRPVRRPDLIVIHRTVEVYHGTPEQLVGIRLAMMHGANYNDPAHYVGSTFYGLKRQG
jgi:cyanobactin biosynthesis protein (PatB/AcyB/McaB family)